MHVTLHLPVLAENESCRFYEAMGGRPVATGQEELGGLVKAKVA